MAEFFSSPLFGIALSIIAFEIGVYLSGKFRFPLINPLLIGIVLVICVLKLFHIPTESYQNGGNVISMFLSPATAVLAITIYSQLDTLKKNFVPIVAGALAGSITSIVSAFLLCRAFGLNQALTMAMVPKSVTTPIAMGISERLSGLVPVTVGAVIITGILGAIFFPALIKLFHIKNPVVRGVAIGTASHAMGTSKALELGETEGAMSGISIGIAGILTVLLTMLL